MTLPHHHGDFDRERELLQRFQEERNGNANREFPEGRLSGDDDGSITFKVGSDLEKNVVAIEFAKPVVWAAMSPQQAVELAQLLIKHARAISKQPIRIQLF